MEWFFQFLAFLFQVDGADIKYRSPGEDEVSPEPCVGSHHWDSFSMTPPDSRNCSQNRHPSSPRNGERGIRGPSLENHREPSSCVSPPSPFASSPSFPSSPLASPFRLFEGAHRRQAHSCLPVSPALNRRGCSLTETSRGLRYDDIVINFEQKNQRHSKCGLLYVIIEL